MDHAKKLKLWRETREGKVNVEGLLGHFDSAVLVATSNDEVEITALQQENADLGHELDNVEEDFEAAENSVVEVGLC